MNPKLRNEWFMARDCPNYLRHPHQSQKETVTIDGLGGRGITSRGVCKRASAIQFR
jgi:Na+-transporting NADH:ubiquinone oxidoreductase subunit NqrC